MLPVLFQAVLMCRIMSPIVSSVHRVSHTKMNFEIWRTGWMHTNPQRRKRYLFLSLWLLNQTGFWVWSLHKGDGAVGSYFNEKLWMGGKRKIGSGEISEIFGYFYLFLQVCRWLQTHKAAHAQKERDKKKVNTHMHT